MKGKVKANTVDKYLRSIRYQIVELVEPDSTVVEFGCGNGDLLFKLSDKITAGIGIDHSKELITYALNRVKEEEFQNLEFSVTDITEESCAVPTTDYAIASLLFHVLPWNNAKESLEKMIAASNTTIICGFSEPENIKQKTLLWFDQRFTGHYANFREYQRHGFTEGLLQSIDNIGYDSIDTFDPVINIYCVTKHN